MSLLALLRQMELVAEVELEAALERAQATGEPYLALLVRDGLVDDDLVARLLSAKLNLNRVDLDKRTIDPRALTMIPAALARRLRAIPVGMRRQAEGHVLYVAMTNPGDVRAMETLQRVTSMTVMPLVATEGALERCLRRHFPASELTDLTPFGILPPDEHVVGPSSEAPPVVVGQLVGEHGHGTLPDDDEATLRSVRDSLLSMRSGGEANLPGSVERDEWLTASTQEVLDVYAPMRARATPITEPTHADLDWLERKAAGESIDSQTGEPVGTPDLAAARTSAQDRLAGTNYDPGQTRVDFIGPTCIVCPDIGLREWIKEKLAGAVSGLRAHAELAPAVAEDVPVANMVLIEPRNEPQLIQALRTLRQREIPPRVYVVSDNKAFEALGGVDVRIDPPRDDMSLAQAVYEALMPRRRG